MLEYIGALISILLVVLSPLYSNKLVQLYANLGFFTPKVWANATIENQYTEKNYPDEFDVNSWSADYRILSISVKNRCQSEIRNVTIQIPAPGAIKGLIIAPVGAHGFSTTSITDRASIGPLDRSEKDILPSSTKVRVHRIEKTGEVNLQFLVDISQSEKETYFIESSEDDEDYSGTLEQKNEIILDFNWEAQNVMLPYQGTIEISDKEDLYTNFDPDDFIDISSAESVKETPRVTLDVYDDPKDNPHFDPSEQEGEE